MKIIHDSKKIDGLIKQIVTISAKRADLIHLTALCSILHCVVHDRSPDKINNLCDAIGQDKPALRKWAELTGLFSYVPKSKDKPAHLTMPKAVWAQERAEYDADADAYRAKLATFKTQAELVKVPEAMPDFDFVKFINAGIGKAERRMKNPEKYGKVTNADEKLIANLKAMVTANQLAI